MATAAQRIAEQFPFLAFLANDPQIGPLLSKAVDVNQPYSPEKFRAEVMKTNWWRKQSETQRAGAIMAATDPGQWWQVNRELQSNIGAMEQRLGVRLTAAERKWIASVAAGRGWAADSREILDAIIRTGKRHGVKHGAIQTGTESVKAIAAGEFFYRMPQKDADYWGTMIAKGDVTVDDWRAHMMKRTWNTMPQFRQFIRDGVSPGQALEGYRNLIAEEMGYSSIAQVDVFSPKWRPLLGIRDAKTNQTRLPTETEVIHMARSQPEWWTTVRGREADAQAATAMAAVFGERAAIGGG